MAHCHWRWRMMDMRDSAHWEIPRLRGRHPHIRIARIVKAFYITFLIVEACLIFPAFGSPPATQSAAVETATCSDQPLKIGNAKGELLEWLRMFERPSRHFSYTIE